MIQHHEEVPSKAPPNIMTASLEHAVRDCALGALRCFMLPPVARGSEMAQLQTQEASEGVSTQGLVDRGNYPATTLCFEWRTARNRCSHCYSNRCCWRPTSGCIPSATGGAACRSNELLQQPKPNQGAVNGEAVHMAQSWKRERQHPENTSAKL